MNPPSTTKSVNSDGTPRSQTTPRDADGKVMRVNTYLQLDLFKWVLIGPTKQQAEEAAQEARGFTASKCQAN